MVTNISTGFNRSARDAMHQIYKDFLTFYSHKLLLRILNNVKQVFLEMTSLACYRHLWTQFNP